MSMPSDVDPDISEAKERMSMPPKPRAGREQLSTEQRGWLVAAVVAFLGIAYVGPAITRYRRRPTLRDRMARRLQATRDETRLRARAARAKVHKRVRRLGGGKIRR